MRRILRVCLPPSSLSSARSTIVPTSKSPFVKRPKIVMSSTVAPSPEKVDLLILGLGWAGAYVATLLSSLHIPYAATTTSGRDSTIKFAYDPQSTDAEPFRALPATKTLLITFPIRGEPALTNFLTLYAKTHASEPAPNYILFGSTRPYTPPPPPPPHSSGGSSSSVWVDRDSTPDPSIDAPRQESEAALLAHHGGCVINLAGLYGGTRDPRRWVSRVAPTLAALKEKGSLHLVHGKDVAQAVVAVANAFTPSQRWLLTDMRVYDWWDLAAVWGEGDEARWALELMDETKCRALPRQPELLGRAVDSRAFWKHFGIVPLVPSVNL
ncbi:hypothetical protein HDU87_006434 [Geranomyces variabilis]|uniref:Uncharacterized protein n=1 Tax=Geranomyces variabilis TaxID=109894 RepID=A0AAD5TFH4_9FUNG|nr:hypothetical protein HDU87_006434 [Geranomyces variabilis]